MKLQPMSAVDAAWFHFDGPVNTAVINSIMLTRAPLDFEQVKRLYRERLVRFPRFSQRVVERGLAYATPHWEAMPDFEVGQQMHHVALPPPGDDKALADLISDLASTPLDRTRPLWEVHVVDGVGHGGALITRMHHCIADGTASVLIARALFGDGSVEAVAPTETESGMFAQLIAPVRNAFETTVDAVAHPQESLRKAGVLLAGAGMLAGELLRADDPPSPLKGEFGLRKRVAWSAPVALADVKEIGVPLGAKINDVLIAGMTGALRTYLRRRGVDVDATTVRAMVPVDLREPERMNELGNAFGVVLLDLAIRTRQRLQRVLATKANMDALKRSPEPVAALALFSLMGRAPKAVEDLTSQMFQSKASVVMTNVAGSSEPLHLTGIPIDRVMFWVPHPGKELGMGISILSYCGYATLGVIADAHLVPDPEAITQEFAREFKAMLKATREQKIELVPVARRHAPAVHAKRAPPRMRAEA